VIKEAIQRTVIADYFFVLRPLLLVPMWAYVILGYFRFIAADGSTAVFSFWEYAYYSGHFMWGIFFYSLCFGAILLINQIADYETDRLHPNIWLIASDIIPIKTAKWEAAVLSAISLAGAYINKTYPLITIITLGVGYVYSCRPGHFSGRPMWDFSVNAVGYGALPFTLGWMLAGGGVDYLLVKNCLPYMLLMAAGAINSTIQDREDDARTGKITTAVKLGIRNALVLSTVILVLGSVVSIAFGDYFCLFLCAAALIFYLQALLKPSRENSLRTLHIPGPVVVLSAGLLYPPLFPVMIAVLVLSKMYYPWRFGINYPQVGK